MKANNHALWDRNQNTMKTLIYSIITAAALSFSMAAMADVEVFLPLPPVPHVNVVVGEHRHHRDYDQVWVPAHYVRRHHHDVWVEGYYRDRY